MIDSAILVALIVAIPTVLASTFTPLAIAWMANHARRRERLEDYARQDLVAERVAETADILTESNKKMALQTNAKLDSIHVLVNSNMTSAMKAELDATVREKAVLIELMSLKETMGHETATSTLVALKAAEEKITELTAVLKDRI